MNTQFLMILNFQMPSLSSGIEDSPVVIEQSRTESQELENACYLVVGTIGLTAVSQDFSFTSKVHFQK